MKNVLRLLLILVMPILMFLAGCGGGGGGNGGDSGTPAATTGSLKLVNSSSNSVNYVYFSPASSSSWGSDQLGATNVIPAGGSYSILNVTPGTYDCKVILNNGTSYYKMGLTITAGQAYTLSVPAATTLGLFKVVNNSSYSVNYVYFSPSTSSSWGSDQLGATNVIPAGGSFSIPNTTPGTYDCKIILSNGTSYYKMGVTITAGQTYTLSVPATTTLGLLKIVNSSSYSAYYVYLSPSSSSSWGSDQLGATHVILSGGSYTISNIAPGTYDCKIILSNGSPQYKYSIVITAGQTYTLLVPSSASKLPAKASAAVDTGKPGIMADGGVKEPVEPNFETLVSTPASNTPATIDTSKPDAVYNDGVNESPNSNSDNSARTQALKASFTLDSDKPSTVVDGGVKGPVNPNSESLIVISE